MSKICPLFSGSTGNSTYIEGATGAVLADVGMSCKAVTDALQYVGGDIEKISAVVITHEHIDHIKGQLQTQGNGLKDCIFSPFSNGKTVKERIEVSRPSLVEDQTAILPCLYQFLILPVIQEFISINCLRQQHLLDIHTLFFSISIYQFILFFSYPSIL